MENITFSSRLKELRQANQLTQTEFALKIGTTQATLSSYETTDRTPALDIVKNISDNFDVSIDWLLGRTNLANTDGIPTTYADIISLFFNLKETFIPNFSLKLCSDSCQLVITDSHIVDFLHEWQKMRNLRDNNIIDSDLYQLWAEKTLQKYKIPIEQHLFNDDGSIFESLPFID